MDFFLITKIIGITAYTLLFMTFLVGIFNKRIILKNKLKIHKILAFSAIILATTHFIFVIAFS